MAEQSKLDLLRKDLDQIDSRIFELVAERKALVSKIAEFKALEERPVFDRNRERDVMRRHRDQARVVGLSKDVGQAISRSLLAASHRVQGDSFQRSGQIKRVLIVGGNGGMGQLFARLFQGRGHVVDCLDRGEEERLDEALSKAEVVLVCVPMGVAVDVASDVASRMLPGTLLCDINSLKLEICEAMGRLSRCEVLGLHPMFGPSVESFQKQKVVCCTVRDGPKWCHTRYLLGLLLLLSF